jgi:hypothetical protein
MYRTAMKWRRENNVDSILQNCPHNWPLLRKIVAQGACARLRAPLPDRLRGAADASSPTAFVGYDHEGRPLLFQKTGLMHTEELCKFSVESILECRIYAQEQALQEMRVASERCGVRVPPTRAASAGLTAPPQVQQEHFHHGRDHGR